MAVASVLGLQVARRVNDAAQSELSAAAYLDFINMAIDDLTLAGWLQRQTEDTSITLVDGTYDYAVPAGFAYIKNLIVADTDGNYPLTYTIPYNHWYVGSNSPSALLHFFPDAYGALIAGRTIKIIGQGRFTGNLGPSDTIVAGAEGFIRERAASYAAETLASGTDEQSIGRRRLAEQAWAKSQQMLGNHPMEFRVQPNSVLVPDAAPSNPSNSSAWIWVDGSTYKVTEPGIIAALSAAAAAGGQRVVVAGGHGGVTCTTGLVAKNGVQLVISEGTWLQPPNSAAALDLISFTGAIGAGPTILSTCSAGSMAVVIGAGLAASIGFVKGSYVVIHSASNSKYQWNKVEYVTPTPGGDVINFVDPLIRDYTGAVDLLSLVTSYLDSFTFQGEIRSQGTGDVLAVYLNCAVNCKIQNMKTSNFSGNQAANAVPDYVTRGTAMYLINGYNNQVLDNYDVGSGSLGYAAYELYGQSHYRLRNNNTQNATANISIIAGKTVSATASTIVLTNAASAVDNAYLLCEVTIVAGPGAGQSRICTGYTGATRTFAFNAGLPWGITPTANSFYDITSNDPASHPELEQDHIGFGIAVFSSHYGQEANNGSVGGKGRGIKHGGCYYWSDTGSYAHGADRAADGYVGYAVISDCFHFVCTGIHGTGSQAAGLWLDTGVANAFPTGDGKFIGCTFINNSQEFAGIGPYEYSGADISIAAACTDIHFTDCDYKTVFDNGTRTMWNGVIRSGAAGAGPSSSAETTVYTLQTPQGWLSATGNGFELELPYYVVNNKGSNGTIHWRGYYTINGVDSNFFDLTTATLVSNAAARAGNLFIKLLNRSVAQQDCTVKSNTGAIGGGNDVEQQTYYAGLTINTFVQFPITIKITATLSASDAAFSLITTNATLRVLR